MPPRVHEAFHSSFAPTDPMVCFPPYLLGRIGPLMLGSHTLFLLGIVLLAAGSVLEAGATSAVKAVKMSVKLVAGRPVAGAGITQGEPERMGGTDE